MIKIKTKVLTAKCDGQSCHKGLVDKAEPHNLNYGILRSSFGFGSRLDDIVSDSRDKHLCEDCWEKALAAVGLKP